MPKICPHCEAEIDCLNYNEEAKIYGRYDIETEDYNSEETEPEGNMKFYCPECDERINNIEDLINIDNEEEENTLLSPGEKELPVPPAIKPEWKGEYSGYHNSHDRQKLSIILTCPKCKSRNEVIENEIVECYNCGKEISIATVKKTTSINPNILIN